MNARDIPNLISILRILLVAPTVYYLLKHDYEMALILFFVAGASDGIDGLLARHFNWQTRLGAILDPIGDKLLLVSCFLVLGWLAHLPSMLIVLVILRDLIIVIGAVSYHMFIEDISIEPVMISKINTVLQISLVVLVIFSMSELAMSKLIHPLMIEYLIWLVYGSTLASGIVYIYSWGKKAMMVENKRGNL